MRFKEGDILCLKDNPECGDFIFSNYEHHHMYGWDCDCVLLVQPRPTYDPTYKGEYQLHYNVSGKFWYSYGRHVLTEINEI